MFFSSLVMNKRIIVFWLLTHLLLAETSSFQSVHIMHHYPNQTRTAKARDKTDNRTISLLVHYLPAGMISKSLIK